ncbi:MAG: hypothetical protein AAGK14_06770 [Verrucomicrobiota bacterium]
MPAKPRPELSWRGEPDTFWRIYGCLQLRLLSNLPKAFGDRVFLGLIALIQSGVLLVNWYAFHFAPEEYDRHAWLLLPLALIMFFLGSSIVMPPLLAVFIRASAHEASLGPDKLILEQRFSTPIEMPFDLVERYALHSCGRALALRVRLRKMKTDHEIMLPMAAVARSKILRELEARLGPPTQSAYAQS